MRVPKPKPGMGHLIGVVKHASTPLANNEVKLCEKYAGIAGLGCQGKVLRTKTNNKGQYAFLNLKPRTFGALLVRVFDTQQFQYPQQGFYPRKFSITAGRATDAGVTRLVKDDLVAHFPPYGARTSPTPKVTWRAYASAASYEVSLRSIAERHSSPTRARSSKTSFVPKTRLAPGRYELGIVAYTGKTGGHKLAKLSPKIVFIVPAAQDPAKSQVVADAPVIAAESKPPSPAPKLVPTPGKGAMWGRVLFADGPAAGIEMKLCSEFNRFFGGCQGKVLKAKTDSVGIFVFKDVTPGEYKALIARVFRTRRWMYISSGLISAKTYQLVAGKVLEAPTTNLVKEDLQLRAPKRGGRLPSAYGKVRWAPYPQAAYYQITIRRKGSSRYDDYYGFRVAQPAFVLDRPLVPGKYTIEIAAFTARHTKLATSHKARSFSVR